MKTIFKLTIAFLALFSFAACSDVPMPYDEPGNDNNKSDSTNTNVVAKGSGTATDPYNVAAALNAINALSSNDTTKVIYVKGAVKEIKQIETEKYGNANYYITDNGSNELYIFQSYYLGNRKFTTSDKLVVGDTVVVCGKFYKYQGNTPETVGKGTSYIYSLNGKTSGDTPVTPSGEAKGSGTATDPYNAAGANKAAAALGAYNKKGDPTLENIYVTGIISKVADFNEKFGEVNYYISDDGTENGDQFYVYGGLGKDGAKFTSATDLKVGQKVTVVGTLINFKGNTPEFQYGSKIVSIEGSGTTTPDTPTSGEAVSISGTTVTLTNSAATAGTETTTFDLNTLGLNDGTAVENVTFPDGTKLTFAKGEKGTTAPAFYTKTKGVRVYLNNTLTFTASKPIAKIVFTCDVYKGTNEVGNKTATVTFSGNTAVYTNADPSQTKGGVQLRVQTITITYAK
jgi:hypothetical protein